MSQGEGVTWITIDGDSAGQRVDNFLIRHWKGVPRSHIYQLIRKGQIRLDKKRVKAATKLPTGGQLRLPPMLLVCREQGSKTELDDTLVARLQRCVLFEDNAIVVLNKPAGWAVHGGSGISIGMIEALRLARPQARSLELVHRLDRETSGCLVIAKKRRVLTALHEAFRDRVVEKRYVALVHGDWPRRKTVVKSPLYRYVAANGERFVRVDHEWGQAAHTELSVAERFGAATLLWAEPKTGRTHQIRVHCASTGFPIVGDKKYTDLPRPSWARPLKGRHFLHCSTLTLPRIEGADAWPSFEAPFEDRLEKTLLMLRQDHACLDHADKGHADNQRINKKTNK
ncbi:MAG: RluA family pseudouridine synthase [Gammaproteobacteria bacterium]